jgi:sugar porter (SP) family MFS transporter
MVTSVFTIGGFLGALGSGPYSSHAGRLPAMKITACFFMLGPAFETLASSIPIMVIGRLLSGVGAGAAMVVVPLYIAEIAPPKERGFFGALAQVGVNVGILLAQSLGYFLSRDQLWRIILGVAGCLGLVQFLGLFLAGESPKWLAAHGHAEKSRQNLERIRGNKYVDDEISTWHIKGVSLDSSEVGEEAGLLSHPEGGEETTETPSSNLQHVGFWDLPRNKEYRPALIAVIGVMLAQQLCGINSIVMYSVSILSALLPTSAALITVLVSAINLVVTIACTPLIDKLGRRPCLLASIAGMGINATLLAISIIYKIKVLSAVATLLFVGSFAIGLGPVPFILASELVGQEAVGATQSWALAANWIATFAVAQGFPILSNTVGKGGVYFIFTGLAAFWFVFVYFVLPETKGKANADEVWGREVGHDHSG